MKKFYRVTLLIFACVLGGILSRCFLADVNTTNVIAFVFSCNVVGNLLHIIDEKLSK